MKHFPKRSAALRATFAALLAALLHSPHLAAAPAPSILGNFGPTGVEMLIQHDLTIKVTGIQPSSPAEGKLTNGQVVTAINGAKLVADPMAQRRQLADLITAAEAKDGVLKFTSDGKDIVVKIPVLGPLSKSWPLDCPKTKKIIRANADYLGSLPIEDLAGHNMNYAFAILGLLSTGEEKDLEAVRKIYQHRMKDFKDPDTGPHTWHNGLQGMAVCEYFLRTGDQSVMPLIDAICESARKYQVSGAWTHWGTEVNPQYVGGGLLNAAGTNVLTTLLLAKQCGAKVNEKTLQDALLFFFRFVGHGANPYGDHRAEDGYGSTNGKTEQLAMAMQVAATSENGQVYAMARDKAALSTLHGYPNILNGHTGPIGLLYYATAVAYMNEKKPELYRNWLEQCRWFFVLSRRHDGAFGLSGGARYDDLEYGRSVLLGLTAPMRTLQITGAPKSPHAKALVLPAQPWGRKADLAFFSLDGGKAYTNGELIPHLELASVADADEAGLKRFASHPEHAFREKAATNIREKGHYGLIEELLQSPDPLARHTACLSLNHFQPWSVSSGRGWLSAKSIPRDKFTQAMFDSLMNMVTNPEEALWLVDQSMIALALAAPAQTMTQLDALLPWLDHQEWWLQESASMALSPALLDPKGMDAILPKIIPMLANNEHNKPRGFVEWMLTRTAKEVPANQAKHITDALKQIYQETPSQPGGSDIGRTGISSTQLFGTLNWVLSVDPSLAPEMAKLSAARFKDMRPRELNLQTTALMQTATKLDPQKRKDIGQVLAASYRPVIIAQNKDLLSKVSVSNTKALVPLNQILRIDQLADKGGWNLLGNNPGGEQEWFYHSFEPAEKTAASEQERYRELALPAELKDWFQPTYDPAQHGWKKAKAKIGSAAPFEYQPSESWSKALKDAGEVIFMRKTFELDDTNKALFRITAFTRQGYRVYLNGHPIITEKSRSKTWQARETYLDDAMKKYLRKGTNIIAATGFLQYFRGKEGDIAIFVESLDQLPDTGNTHE